MEQTPYNHQEAALTTERNAYRERRRTNACTGVAAPVAIKWMRHWRRPGDAGRYRIDMISRRMFTAVCLAAPFGGCRKRAQTSEPPWNRVEGFAAVNDRRIEVVDGFLDFGYEPMEWKAYSFRIHFWHDFLTDAERSVVFRGAWVDPNHKTVPEGFAMAPSVSVSLGRWRFSEQPHVDERTKSTIHFRGFLGNGTSNIEHTFQATPQVIDLAKHDRRFAINWSSVGEHRYENIDFNWDLSFSGLCYGDDWMLSPEAASRDY